MAYTDSSSATIAVKRVRMWYALVLLVMAIFGIRLFYVQIIRYDHYKQAALNDQLKQYEIPATRGIIKAYDGETVVPIVLNQTLYTLYADPVYIKDVNKTALELAAITGGHAEDYQEAMQNKGTRYVVLAKKLSESQSKKILSLEIPGVGTQKQNYRTYPQGQLASQLLGFVNNDGVGTYGIEQALNTELEGTVGRLKAITDLQGVPLASNQKNTIIPPTAGDDITLTIDLGMQRQLETILKKGKERSKAPSVSAVIMDVKTGAVKAMANYPTYDPAHYDQVSNASLFNNAAVSHPIEIGSVMKVLTTAAALDRGVIRPDTSYYDPSYYIVDDFRITNIEEDGGAGTRNIAQLLDLSLNTGATWELMRMGGADEINRQGREVWYDYMTNHYRFSKATGIEQGYEAMGYVPLPKNNGAGINLTYANTAFGQAMTATPLQVASALSAVLNGGTYYQPHLVDRVISSDGTVTPTKPVVVKRNVVSPEVSRDMVPLMQYVIDNHFIQPPFDQSKYVVGGKTGTAQVAKPDGGYYDDVFNGTYMGFVGGDTPQYVITVFVYRPNVDYYAGTAAAQPIFANLAHMLIDNSYVAPKHR